MANFYDRPSPGESLLSEPKVVLMDEPFQGLDIMSTRDLQETIVNLQTEDYTRSCIISLLIPNSIPPAFTLGQDTLIS